MKSSFDIFLDWLPAIDAGLNAVALCFLIFGYRQIKKGNKEEHKKFMVAAFATSTVFLCCYLTRYYFRGSTAFPVELETLRIIYFIILVPHIILAAVMVPMILMVLFYAYKQEWSKHKKLAKITFPIWVYVSFTGIIVYLMLYQLAPSLSV